MVYKNLIDAMNAKKLSSRALAEIAHMPEPTFRSKLNGRSECGFSLEEAFNIKDNAFPEMEIRYLFAREETA